MKQWPIVMRLQYNWQKIVALDYKISRLYFEIIFQFNCFIYMLRTILSLHTNIQIHVTPPKLMQFAWSKFDHQTIKRKKNVYYNEFFYYNKFKIIAIKTYCNQNILFQTIAVKLMAIDYCNKKQH